eukprot:TRINITY_DN6625_c0_g1_i1.p1 TRINITY_DN6625_c0_g1~~TRINITY_DN6625_c0_g1_i1.p1  ORF type:complete len:291 (+),score=43.50 TRINITY_DN6625_c0_g1_i1:356-1228(+)
MIGTAPGVKIDPPCTAIPPAKLSVGPGAYNPTLKENVPTHIMGKAGVKQQGRYYTMASTPGPGSYQPDASFNYLHSGLSKSMGGVLVEPGQQLAKETPGPGAYNPQSQPNTTGPKIKARTVSQVKALEKKVAAKERQYATSPKPLRPTFGRAQRGELAPKLVTPGPDAYQRVEVKSVSADKESCKFGMKTGKFFQANKNPGPDTYYPFELQDEGLAYSIGRGSRANQKARLYTDQYYLPKNLFPGPSIGFTRETRQSEGKKSRYPGAGTYNIPDTVGIIPEYLLHDKVFQ